MGDYDKVIKENIEAIFLPLLEKFTGIRIVKSDEIKDNQPAGGQESSELSNANLISSRKLRTEQETNSFYN